VYQCLLDNQFGRDDVLVALGGGMITDLGAFVASTYKRGMDFLLVSTSLLGCVDAAVGGKAAVNFGPAKNQIGLFTVPAASVLDLLALGTLPARQVLEGLVEAYKTGLIWDTGLAALIEANLGILKKRDLAWIAEIGARSATAKAQVVSEDFREGGLRRILNYGHTYGHAVEGWHGYRISHGQCVAAGMLVATEISRRRGLIDCKWAATISDTVLGMAPRRFALPEAADAWPIMANDKKNRAGRVLFVLLTGPASHVCVEDVTPDELQAAITSVEHSWHE
jgi:3-dehydroquinate synthetase